MTPDETYDAFLMDHAAGALTPGLAMLADEHMRMSAHGRSAVDAWTMIGGALFELDSGGVTTVQPLATRVRSASHTEAAVRRDFDALAWRVGFSGVAFAPGSTPNTKYMRLGPGASAPTHSHSVLEATLVLSGALSDGERTYEVGEIAFGVPGERHTPQAIGTCECVCFVAQEPKPFWRLS